MKNAIYTLSLGLLLVGCGLQSTPVGNSKPLPSTGKPAFTGLEVSGQPNILKRHITLSKPQLLGTKAGSSLKPQAMLPAWTGPRDFDSSYSPAGNPSFDASTAGELFTQKFGEELEMFKYSATGQLLHSKKSDKKMMFIENQNYDGVFYTSPSSNWWLIVTEDSPEKEVYQISDTSGSHYYGDIAKGGSQLLGEVYGSSLIPLRAATDPVYPIFLFDPFPVINVGMSIKAGKEGVVMLATSLGVKSRE
ncbi:hypothetical protein [Deinococcus irradiatisoli]|uniref:hypothetical protein n=1 Tax=Deinococcus irradiatisoli TaxID=2202254 RepID=UPI0011B1DFD4|nr:hypothetical protein [Deinococcus irradiatisoli]